MAHVKGFLLLSSYYLKQNTCNINIGTHFKKKIFLKEYLVAPHNLPVDQSNRRWMMMTTTMTTTATLALELFLTSQMS